MKDRLNDLFLNHYGVYVKKISRRVPNVADAEDIVQTAFERALRYADTFDENRQELEAWFHTLVNNAYKDWLRADRLGGMTVELDERNGGEYVCSGDSRQLAAVLSSEIVKTRGVKKSVLYRRFMMDITPLDISKIMGIGIERVKKILLRFRQDMRNKYGESLI